MDAYYPQYANGRLTAIQYHAPGCGAIPITNTVSVATNQTKFIEMYSYNQGGRITKKRLRVIKVMNDSASTTSSLDFDSTHAYDNEGRMTSAAYPLSGPQYTMAYDSMGRAGSLTDQNSATIASASYGTASELLSLNGQSFTYNSMFQLTRIQGNGIDISYGYPSTQNNGKIASQTDNISGEIVVYAYDSLQRLASAATTAGTSWGQSYTYDGWGNLLGQTVTQGSAPTYSVLADPATNRINQGTFDANGNAIVSAGEPYDIETRLTMIGIGSNTQTSYGYTNNNKRVYKGNIQFYSDGVTPPSITLEEVYFYSVTGQKIATYMINGDQSPTFQETSTNVWFGGRLVRRNGTAVGPDRLGSIGKYYPYGQEKSSGNPANGQEKFATYTRDGETGLDYADQRYHGPGTGRFLSPDPYQASGGPGDPGSWNRYGYTRGDPVGRIDRSGLEDTDIDGLVFSVTTTLRQVDVSAMIWLQQLSGIALAKKASVGGGAQYSKAFTKTVEKLSNANEILHTKLNGNLSAECQTDMANLASIGISSVGILLMADTVNWVDASTDTTDLAADMYPTSDEDYELMLRRAGTINQYVSGTTAASAALPGSALWGNIYFNSSLINLRKDTLVAATYMHELLHVLGPTDPQIQAALFGKGSPEVGAASVNISDKLYKDCFK